MFLLALCMVNSISMYILWYKGGIYSELFYRIEGPIARFWRLILTRDSENRVSAFFGLLMGVCVFATLLLGIGHKTGDVTFSWVFIFLPFWIMWLLAAILSSHHEAKWRTFITLVWIPTLLFSIMLCIKLITGKPQLSVVLIPYFVVDALGFLAYGLLKWDAYRTGNPLQGAETLIAAVMWLFLVPVTAFQILLVLYNRNDIELFGSDRLKAVEVALPLLILLGVMTLKAFQWVATTSGLEPQKSGRTHSFADSISRLSSRFGSQDTSASGNSVPLNSIA